MLKNKKLWRAAFDQRQKNNNRVDPQKCKHPAKIKIKLHMLLSISSYIDMTLYSI